MFPLLSHAVTATMSGQGGNELHEILAQELIGKSLDKVNTNKTAAESKTIVDEILMERMKIKKKRTKCGQFRYKLREILDSMGVMMIVAVLVLSDVAIHLVEVIVLRFIFVAW